MAKTYITLNEAVTWLAFGEPRAPNEELEMRRLEQLKITTLIDICLTEAQSTDNCALFPKRLAYWPLRALVDRLDCHRNHWPPSAKRLRALAVSQNTRARSGLMDSGGIPRRARI